jgi:hypothetical protein
MPLLPVDRAANDTRGRKKISGQRVSGGDAPVVNPGLARARPLNAPSGAFDSGLSQITQEIAPELKSAGDSFKKREILEDKKMAEMAALQVTRTDITERVRMRQNYRKLSEKFKTDFAAENDLSDPKHAATLNKRIVEMRGEILSDFAGSDLGRANATKDIDTMEAGWTQTLAKEITATQLKKLDQEVARELAPLDNEITGATTMAEYEATLASGEERIDGFEGGESEMLTVKRRESQRSHIATMMVQKALNTGTEGHIERAELLLKSDRISKELSKEDRDSLRSKIQTAKKNRKDLNFEIQKTRALEKVKLEAKSEFIAETLADYNLPGLNGASGVDPDYVANPLGVGVEATQDFKDASRLFGAAGALFEAGLNQEALAMTARAKYLIETSPDIQKEQELDKPISESLAAKFQVPVGTTMRGIVGRIPDSPEKSAGKIAEFQAKSKEKVKSETTIGFINEADSIIKTLEDELLRDPTLVGAVGSLRAKGQTAIGILNDFGADQLVDTARDLAFTESDLELDEQYALFKDPTLSVLSIIENSLGMIVARMRTPEARVAVETIRQAKKDVNLTGFSSSQDIQNRLKFVSDILNFRKTHLQKRFAPEGVNEPGESKPTHRVVDGKIVPIVDEGDDGLKKK